MRNAVVTKNLKILQDIRASRHHYEPDPFLIYSIKFIWIYPIIVAISYFLSSMFISSFILRMSLAILLSIFPWYGAVNKLYGARYTHLRTELLVLLQTLCTSVSSGYSIEKSFTLVRPIIEHTLGKKSVLIKPLIELEHSLSMHVNLQQSIDTFASHLNFPEVVPVFHALGISGRIGNNALAILRSSCQMLSEMSAVQGDIEASNSGKNAEAGLLCIMPFVIIFALNKMSSDYLQMARNTKIGSILLAIAFALSIIAAALLFRFMTHGNGRQNRKVKKQNLGLTKGKKNRYQLSSIAQNILPSSVISKRFELFNQLSINPTEAYEKYIRKQIITISLFLCLSALILVLLKKNLVLLIPLSLAIYYLNLSDVKNSTELKKEDIMRDIPLFLCLMSTLLESGIQLPRSINICAEAFPDNKSLSIETKNLKAMILSGISASDAIEKLSLRLRVPEAQSALLLIARYGRLGTGEVLNLLSLQSSACWNLCRNAARKKQERESLAMLLPMTLDFICVLLVATTPAIISLGI